MEDELKLKEIFSHKINKVDVLCRICLSENKEKSFSLFEVHGQMSPSDKIMLCTGIKIHNDDNMPKKICEECSKELNLAHHFRTKCEFSDALLKKVYQDSLSEDCDIKILDPSQKMDSTISLTNKDMLCDNVDSLKTDSKYNVWIKNEETVDYTDDDDAFNDDIALSNFVKKTKKHKIKNELKTVQNNNLEIKDEPNDSHEYEDLGLCNLVEDLKNDNINTSKKKKVICHICGKPLSTKYSLEKHLSKMHSDKKANKSRNVSGYGKTRRFHCTVCSYITKHSQSLVYHLRIHSGEKPYRCEVCSRSFAQPGSLKSHLKTHSDKMYYTCTQCGKQFKYRETYETHKSVHIEERKFVCQICNKGLKSRTTLEGHMNRHYNIKNYSCEMCGLRFVTKVELLNHSKKHSAHKKFECNFCDFRTYLKKCLELHLRRHTGDRQFKCDFCELSCYTRGELKCHMRKHTREKNYSCPVCQQRFIHSSSVNKHMLKTHGIKYRRNDTIDRRVIK